MPTTIKRANGYQCKIRLTGHAPESATFETKAKALAWGHAREAELRAQASGTFRATLQAAIDRYVLEVCPLHRAGDNEAKRIQALARTPGLLPVLKAMADVLPADISKFRDTRLERVSIATVRKEMTILRSVFEAARRDWGMLQVNPMADVKKPPAPPHRQRLFVGDERERIIEALGYEGEVKTLQHQVAVALLIAFETAMRAVELIDLEWHRVHLAEQYVSLDETKNGDRRDVPLSRRAVALLASLKGLDPVRVFTVTDASRDALFRKARIKCKIDDLHFHDSRANAITALSKKLDIHDLARAIGHRDIRSLQIYYRRTASDIAKGLD